MSLSEEPTWEIVYPPLGQATTVPVEATYTDSLPCDPSLYSDRPIRRAPCPCCGYDGTQDLPKRLQFTTEELLERAKNHQPPPEFYEGDVEKPF